MKISELSLQQIKEQCDKYENDCSVCPLKKWCRVLRAFGTDFDEITFQLSGYFDEEVPF